VAFPAQPATESPNKQALSRLLPKVSAHAGQDSHPACISLIKSVDPTHNITRTNIFRSRFFASNLLGQAGRVGGRRCPAPSVSTKRPRVKLSPPRPWMAGSNLQRHGAPGVQPSTSRPRDQPPRLRRHPGVKLPPPHLVTTTAASLEVPVANPNNTASKRATSWPHHRRPGSVQGATA
jgi:hypothetical protein